MESCVAASHVLKTQNAPPCENYFHGDVLATMQARKRPKTVTRISFGCRRACPAFSKDFTYYSRARNEIFLFSRV